MNVPVDLAIGVGLGLHSREEPPPNPSPPIGLRDLADLLIGLNGAGNYKLILFRADHRAIDIGNYHADFRMATEVLGWQPKVTLADGLKRTLEFYWVFGGHNRS